MQPLHWLDFWEAEALAKTVNPEFVAIIDENIANNGNDGEWNYHEYLSRINPSVFTKATYRYTDPFNATYDIYSFDLGYDRIRRAEVLIHESIHSTGRMHSNRDYFTTYRAGKRSKKRLNTCYHGGDLLSHWIANFLLYGEVPPNKMVALRRCIQKILGCNIPTKKRGTVIK